MLGAPLDEPEGVIQFALDFSQGPPPPHKLLRSLNAWRTILHRLGLTAQDPARYGGLAFGNVSLRVRGLSIAGSTPLFVISGSQTGGLHQLDNQDYCWVTGYDLSRNRIRALGPIPPSSETLTHAAVYGADERIQCVIHIHSPEIWDRAEVLALPQVAPAIGYGTPDMAAAIGALVARNSGRLIAMAGHRDGIVSYGHTVEEAAEQVIAALASALSLPTTAPT
jgi:ribulose-5-phosphate 4-epimerase/fuculose-1-phosphate aldolase